VIRLIKRVGSVNYKIVVLTNRWGEDAQRIAIRIAANRDPTCSIRCWRLILEWLQLKKQGTDQQ
jgi:hypothetical protein